MTYTPFTDMAARKYGKEKRDREEEQDTTVEIEDEARFNEQCFLIDNIARVAANNVAISESEQYRNFMMVQDDPVEATQMMIGKPGIEELFKLTPAQLALIVPKIRIFKEIPDNKSDNKAFVELAFEDRSNLQDIEKLTGSRKTRGSEIGLKSFSYKLTGKRPEEGGMANCTLELFFQNISSLLHPDKGDVTTGAASFRDLITLSQKKTQEDKKVSSETKKFRIQIIVGWAVPSDPKNALGFTKGQRAALDRTSTSLFLNLYKHDLDFREDGALTVTLYYSGAIEGAMREKGVDLLKLTKAGEAARNLRASLTAKEKAKTQAAGPSGKPSSIDDPLEASVLTEATNSIAGKKSRLRELYNTDKRGFLATPEGQRILLWNQESAEKTERYSRILKSISEKSRIWFVNVDSKNIRGFKKSMRELLKKAVNDASNLNKDERKSIADATKPYFVSKGGLSGKSTLTAKELEEITRDNYIKNRRIGLNAEGKVASVPFPKIQRKAGTNEKIDRAQKRMKETLKPHFVSAKDSKMSWTGTLTLAAKGGGEEAQEKHLGHLGKWDATAKTAYAEPGKLQLQFFYFGDLIEAALEIIEKKQIFKVLLGPFIFTDPRTGKSTILNLADIPISLNLFIMWWTRRVISSNKQHYYLGEFIKDVFSSLIKPALGADCFPDMESVVSSISMALLDAPKGRVKYLKGKRSRIEVDKEIDVGLSSKSHQLQKEYFFYIYVSSYAKSSLRGNYKEDIKRGIYHLSIGNERGLVKSVKFTKTDIPWKVEAEITNNSRDGSHQGGTTGAVLKSAVYDADIKMVGNSLFNLGTKVFLDTSTLGDGFDPRKENSWAKELGLGGYYTVATSEHFLSRDDYETEMRLRYESSGAKSEKHARVSKKALPDRYAQRDSKREISEKK